MNRSQQTVRIVRFVLGVMLVVVGLSTTWAWGQVARLAEPAPEAEEPQVVALYAAWQPVGAEQAMLFRSADEGATWQTLALPDGFAPVAWADDGGERVAVVTEGGSLLRSADGGDTWTVAARRQRILSLAWGDDGTLYLGTDGQGVIPLASDGTPVSASEAQGELASARVVGLSLAEGRLFAATPTVLFYTDDGGKSWTKSLPVPESVTTIAAADRQRIYAGTATVGVYKSTDAGRSWQPAWEGLGLAAGQMVSITALRADSQEPGVLYAAVNYRLGSTQIHDSAAGSFLTLDGGASWQPLAGPAFPEAKQAVGLVVVPGKPLYVQAVTVDGLQSYAPDVMRLLAALESAEPATRAAAARQLGLARPQGVWNELLALLDDPEPAVSLAAAEALGRINDPASVGGLLVAIEHPNQQVRLGAARALGMMGVEAAVPPLRAMLLGGEGLAVTVAGEALGRLGSPAAIDALLAALADSVPTGRWHVAMAALEKLGEPAVEPLVAMLASQDPYARRNASQALGWVGSPSATAALVRALQGDADAGVRREAAWALGEIADPAARSALERAQQRDPAATVQAEAAWALVSIPQASATAPRWTAAWAPALSRLQPLRWLVLALSLAAALWLMAGDRKLAPAFLRQRVGHR